MIGTGLMVFLSVAGILFFFDFQQTRIHKMFATENAAEIGNQVGKAIENEINKRLVTVNAIAAFRKTQGTPTQAKFEAFAKQVENGDEAILSLQLAPDGVVKFLTNPARNSKALGHDILADPVRWAKARQSIRTGNFLIDGPLELLQGGQGLIARQPLYDVTAEGQQSFWGFATIVLDFAAVTNLFSAQNEQALYRYALREEFHNAFGNVFWGDADIFDQNPHLTTIVLATGSWQLATLPVSGWPTGWPHARSYRFISILVAGLLMFSSIMALRRPQYLRIAVQKATADLTETEQKLREAHRMAKIGSWSLFAEGKVEFSQESLGLLGLGTGCTSSDIATFYTTIHPEDRDLVRMKYRSAVAKAESFECTFRVNKSEGTIIVINLRAQFHEGHLGKNRIMSGTIQDITAQSLNEERLRRAQKMEAIGQLTGGVAHDFNNLLAVIQGNAELLELELDQDLVLVGEIKKATRRGAELTHRLLAYARQQPLSPEPTDLAELIKGMKNMLSQTLGEHIHVDLEFSEDLWAAKVDAGQIEDALLSLALNARDAMPRGGDLSIVCSNTIINNQIEPIDPDLIDGEYVVISVSDTGTGMAKNVRLRAFEPFFTTKEVGKGSGLGLSKVCGFARQSGGAVAIQSSINKGTTVHIYLPRGIPKDTGQTHTTASFDIPHGVGERVPSVEDNPVGMNVLSRKLVGLNDRMSDVSAYGSK